MLATILDELRASPRFAPHITAWHRLPAQPPRYADWPAALDERVVNAARKRGIHRPWTHQAQAIRAALEGQHVVIATPTASGKTLCYNAVAFHRLLRDPAARALYLFPTKALAHDQLAELEGWTADLEAAFHPAAYDGDTPMAARPRVRRQARIVITNPDMLHTGILPHHTRWAALFRGLRLVVLDELHVYRGVFGSHVANVLRRLRRIARFYGSAPLFIGCSATIANPQELAQRLVEAPVTVIDADGSPKGERHFIFYNPPIVDRQLGLRRSALLEAGQLARRFLAADVQTIVFTRARQATERLVRYLRGDGTSADVEAPSPLTAAIDSTPSPALPRHGGGGGERAVHGYRGGYRPAERRAIERGLRDGSIRAVVSTNALELGIDIGPLDACVMAGYPGTIAATWQQAGRAGRRGGLSVAVLVAGGNPLDQYIVTHPRYFFERSPEHARIHPDNLLILLDHLRCAAFELPFRPGESFGEGAAEGEERGAFITALLDYLAEAGELHRVGGTYYWMAEGYPAERVSLRAAGPDPVVITDVTEPEAPRVLGSVERASAPLLVHEGAVYLHDGVAYHVDRLDWEAGQAFVRAVETDCYTDASHRVDVRPIAAFAERAVGGAAVFHGEVQVTSRATGYRKVRFDTHETLGWGEIELPEQTMSTTGYWFVLHDETVERLRRAGWWRFDPVGYRGPNWREQRAKARARDGYRCRHCGAPEKPGRQHDIHHLRPFRDFGYVPGENEAYREANRLDNLITLCRACHRRAENAQRFQGALTGLGHVLGHVAPLFLMCDRRDIGVLAEVQSPATRKPTVTVYEKVPGGVGFSETLFRLHAELLTTARELIESCPCERGCPSCVGPVDAVGEDAKGYTLAILRELAAG